MPELPEPDIYRAVLESLPYGVYIVDRHRVVQLWNDGAEHITGYLRHEVIGRSCQECLLMYSDEDDRVLCGGDCPLSDTLRDGRPRQTDLFLRHKDGSRVPVKLYAAPVRDSDGGTIGVAACLNERVLLTDAQVHLHTRAVQDALDLATGIPNRESVRRHLDAVLEDFREEEFPFCVLSIQIDRLEELRQSHGIRAVEAMARVVARTLAKNLHSPDIVGRWSESRFVAVLTNCPASALLKMTALLRRVISGIAIPWWGDRVAGTISIGATPGHREDTAEALIGRAEQALERALLAGGGQAAIL
ncbi:MAG TPA: diguanylate cyclase [Bryobacteraceae bacterium]|nr:diguanylate cyclase [Bryobacteraceae bacterium]